MLPSEPFTGKKQDELLSLFQLFANQIITPVIKRFGKNIVNCQTDFVLKPPCIVFNLDISDEVPESNVTDYLNNVAQEIGWFVNTQGIDAFIHRQTPAYSNQQAKKKWWQFWK
jgi:hypothetical protein